MVAVLVLVIAMLFRRLNQTLTHRCLTPHSEHEQESEQIEMIAADIIVGTGELDRATALGTSVPKVHRSLLAIAGYVAKLVIVLFGCQ